MTACKVCGCEERTPEGHLQCGCPAPGSPQVGPCRGVVTSGHVRRIRDHLIEKFGED